MTGSLGTGKTLLARTLPSILPPLSLDEALDVTKIYSVSGNLSSDQRLISRRPFRAPHHTTSHAGLVRSPAHPHRNPSDCPVVATPLKSALAAHEFITLSY